MDHTQLTMPWKTLNDLFLGRVVILHMDQCIGQPTAKGYADTYVGWCDDINELGIVLRHMKENGDDLFSFHYHDKIGSICQCEDANGPPKKDDQPAG